MGKRKSKRLAAKRTEEEASDNCVHDENTVQPVTGDVNENEKPVLPVDSLNQPKQSAPDDIPLMEDVTDETLPVRSSPPRPCHPEVVKETEPVPPFQPIDSNCYLFDRRKCRDRKDIKRMVCDCILTKEERQRGVLGCGDDCINRLLMMECGQRCPLGDHCTNKRFQKKQYVKAEPFRAGLKGWGLRVMQPVAAGDFIMEYVGEVVDPDEFRSRVKRYSREGQEHHYFMALKSDEIIDATVKGNVTRFVNHSCEPTCETQKWTVNGELRIGFFAIRNLVPGDEVTFDYQFQRYGKEAQKCHCEAPSCRGFIGASESSTIDLDGSRLSNRQRSRIASIDSKIKAREFEDLALEAEIEKLISSGCLKSKNQTMTLARLMVRTEDCRDRVKLLDIVNNTRDTVFLRLFMDYQGLQLLWSWMADSDDPILKASILQILSILPVPNRTVLVDSKILEMVEKWAREEEPKPQPILSNDESLQVQPPAESMADVAPVNPLNEETEKLDPIEKSENEADSVAEPAAETSVPESSQLPEHISPKIEDDVKTENPSPDSEVKPEETREPEINESSQDSQYSEEKGSSLDGKEANAQSNAMSQIPQISQLAQRLLHMWKDLKEGFKIPRLKRQKRQDDEQEADRRAQEYEMNRARGLPYNYNLTGKRGPEDRDGIANILLRNKKKKESTNAVPANYNDFHIENQPTQSEPTGPVSAKEAHRMNVEMDLVKQEHEETKAALKADIERMLETRRQLLMAAVSIPDPLTVGHPILPPDAISLAVESIDGYNPLPSDQVLPFSSAPASIDEFDAVYDEDFVVADGYYLEDDYSEWLPVLTVDNHSNIVIECSGPDNELMADERAVVQTDYGTEFHWFKQKTLPSEAEHSTYPAGIYYECVYPDTVYFVPHFIGDSGDPSDFAAGEAQRRLPSTCPPDELAPLPRHWRRTRDKTTGRIYYYDKRTGVTQWNLPEFSPSQFMLIPDPIKSDECSKSQSVVAKADSTSTPHPATQSSSSPSNSMCSPPGIFAITNGHSKSKKNRSVEPDQSVKRKHRPGVYDLSTKGLQKFKFDISEFVKKVLSPYQLPDCKVSRIETPDDFKQIARKLVNEIYDKEMNSGKKELVLSEPLKMKAKLFIRKFMTNRASSCKSNHSPGNRPISSLINHSDSDKQTLEHNS